MSLKELDLLIEQILKEREYVSGSKLPTQKPLNKPGGQSDSPMTNFGATTGNVGNLKTAIKRLIDYCSGVSDKNDRVMKSATTSEKFKRVIASEFLHKLLNTTIPATNALGFKDEQAGFSLEKQFASLLGGRVIPPAKFKTPEDVQFVSGGGKWSMKFYKASTIKDFGFGQALSTMENWKAKNTNKKGILRYLIFVKLGNKDKVGFELFEAEYSYKEVEDIINKHKQEAANSKTVPLEDRFYITIRDSSLLDYEAVKDRFKAFGSKNALKTYNKYKKQFNEYITEFEAAQEDETDPNYEGLESWKERQELPFRDFISNKKGYKKLQDEFIKKHVSSIKLHKGKMPEFGTGKGGKDQESVGRVSDEVYSEFEGRKIKPLGRLLMPRNIDQFMENAFVFLENDINELYTNLDNFRDSLKEYYLDSNEATRTTTEDQFTSLSGSFNKSFNEDNKLYATTLEENVKKSKK